MTFLFFSDISWNNLWQRPHHFASRFARNGTVLWIEPIVLGQWPSLKPRSIDRNVVQLSLPVIPYNARNKWIRFLSHALSHIASFRRFVRFLQNAILRRALRALGIDSSNTVFVIQNFHFAHLVSSHNPAYVLFDYIDNAFGFVDLPDHCGEEFASAVRRADAVTVTSRSLEAEVRRHRDAEIHLVSNGVEFNKFASPEAADRPRDLPEGSPIVGYVGSVYSWIDFDLVDFLCACVPHVRFVFIGRAHPQIAGQVSRLEQRLNFSFLGFRKYEQLPQYMKHFDVAIIPFQRTILTESVNPVKLYEYSAAGIPTITTLFSDELLSLNDLIFVARDDDEFVKHLENLLQHPLDTMHRHRLVAFARSHDWDAKFSLLDSLIRKSRS